MKILFSLFLFTSLSLRAQILPHYPIQADDFNQRMSEWNDIIISRGDTPPNISISSNDVVSRELFNQIHEEYSSLSITYPIPSCINNELKITAKCINNFLDNLEGMVSALDGGNISLANENDIQYRVHTFQHTGEPLTLSSSMPNEVEYLIVAGGGGGGSGVGNGNASGGGGAGGLIQGSMLLAPSTEIYTGDGGVGASGRLNFGGGFQRAGKGENSYINSTIAFGGGAGGSAADSSADILNGASGGGASVQLEQGSGILGQGFAGGLSSNDLVNWYVGGGGGGSGGPGQNGATNAGAGGVGTFSTISGTNTVYAAGGGGSAYRDVNRVRLGGLGGNNCGGNGANAGTNEVAAAGSPGLNHRGCGGGAGSSPGTGYWGGSGGAGGSGVIIIRYPWKN